MKKFLQRIKRQYLAYLRSDRNSILILAGLLLVSVLINGLVDYLPPKEGTDFSEIKKLMEEWEAEMEIPDNESRRLFSFNPNSISGPQLDSLDIPEPVKRNIISYRRAGGRFKTASDFRKIYGMTDSIYEVVVKYLVIPLEKPRSSTSRIDKPKVEALDYFDPNTVAEEELKAMGFTNYQASNLVNYRLSGGVFRKADDILKIYGVDSVLFVKVKPYIKLDSIKEVMVPSFDEIPMVELNSADSALLTKLPGIGPAYAKRIIRYRELLGGYYSPKQLLEVYNFPEDTFYGLEDYVYVDTLEIRKMRINFLEFAELLHHPYLSKEQVAQILDRKKKLGAFKSIAEVAALQSFDDVTFERVRPYLTCR
ncbi:helix-hairpin-helix domain-containing protein [Maribellus sp. CM-23]|uniref:helix-hairpin-helix domain-containing protein n=1 Tax=Maribellus sp. CM-23 TaxID=2781026 RepID=UPI001F247A83|nr:helix-hairpin-helix domain-containing protein [Maribellus sp. CM-23]MCE4563149.1 helix-hairpin-helix domain-containing protein [Maribellus sp. CM-23]